MTAISTLNNTRFIVAGNLIDGSGGKARRNVFLAVRDTRIIAIEDAAGLPRNTSAIIDDFSHCTILPPLVDGSVSLSRSPATDAGRTELTVDIDRHIRYCHAHGVLGVADSDDINGQVELCKETMAARNIIDIRTSGRLRRSGEDTDADDHGGDFLKIICSGNVGEESRCVGIDHDDLGRILDNRGGRKAVVVANGPQPVRAALAAGCDAIEQGYAMGRDNLRAMAGQGVLWFPGLLRAKSALDCADGSGNVCCRFSQRYAAPGKAVPEAEAYWKKVLADQLAQLRFARKIGVTTAVGTGAGSVGIIHGESMVEEMKLFVRAGYSLEETIHCASATCAGFFAMDRIGILAVGKRATFLVARGTVKQLPRKLSYLEGIYIDGSPSSAYQKTPR